ncbi:MAG: oxygen-independent coproporphyrinogen III oxidase-like protein [Burkholderiales bacterium]|nr:oxygen-independent coproporphyrinogen III oxidase-like protein [Burkholderiales bacterium]
MTSRTVAVSSRSSLITPRSSLQFSALPPLSLYIHVPWCVRKCPYCDFNSHEARGTLPEGEYVAALLADLESALPQVWGRPVLTVFIGGGTPSLLSVPALDALLSGVRARLPLAADAEITLEANPGTVEAGKFAGFRAAGVNRLSLGIQSLNDRHLRALGRIHDAGEARRAAELALATFDNVNLDLMYGLPGQTPQEAEADIAAVIALAPQHVSAYHLTIEPNTYFHRYPPAVPDDDAAAAMQAAVEARLDDAGYGHYETSAFARPGRQSRHNLNYWNFGDYLGIGAGAHGKISFKNNILRESRTRQPKAYLARAATGAAVGERRELTPAELPGEFMMNALRLNDGFELALFVERTGLDLTCVLPVLDQAEARGLLQRDHRHVRPTPLGRRFLNDLLELFLP